MGQDEDRAVPGDGKGAAAVKDGLRAGESRCGELACVRYTWPGKPEAVVCIDHAQQIAGIAQTMGLPLQLIPISYSVAGPMVTEFPTCSSIVKDGA